MIKYHLWAVGEKCLSFVPFGKNLYHFVGSIVNRRSRGTSDSFRTSFRLARKAKELIPPGGTVLEVGTGWFHHDAFLLYLLGDYKIYLFDVQDKGKIYYIHNYLRKLLSSVELIAFELNITPERIQNRLRPLLEMTSREEIYEKCNFKKCITTKTDEPFLPENSVDFMISCCVLNHIPIKILIPELIALRKMLKADGAMYHLIGHDDHWTFHDRSANQFNYYRYSDAHYKCLYESLEFNSRIVKQECLQIFKQCGLHVEDYYAHITEESRKQIQKLPRINSRFSKYPLEELAIIYSYVLLRKQSAILSINSEDSLKAAI
jgi:hypothetical protein